MWSRESSGAYSRGYVPGTDIRLGRLRDGEHEHRPGVDITLSAPKSVSLEALLGDPGSARAMRAHEAAVRATLAFIETRLLRTRRWSREERRSVQVNAPMLVAATFRHITSRNNDPQLHTHCVIANMTRDGAAGDLSILRGYGEFGDDCRAARYKSLYCFRDNRARTPSAWGMYEDHAVFRGTGSAETPLYRSGILDHCCHAWNNPASQPARIASIGNRKRAHGF